MDDSKALTILFELAEVVVDPDTKFLQNLIDDVAWRQRRFPAETKHDTVFDTACKHWSSMDPEQVKEAFRIVAFLIEFEKRREGESE